VRKAWYNFFVVTEGAGHDAAPADAAPTDATPRRVTDVVPDAGTETTFTAPVTNSTSLGDIYRSAQIATPTHGYTVLKVAEMLQSEHIRALPPDVKRKSILVALEAAGVTVQEIVEDAVHRDRALDTYERVLQKNLETLRSEKHTENARIEQEIAERLAELRARLEENNAGISRELEHLRTWQSRKQEEERRIAEAVSYFVSENPITTTESSADGKGDAKHVR
jgi:Asp-tRNA(Asn)/Glu-tRNA(Gln) amidotransferase A subunit family amidase